MSTKTLTVNYPEVKMALNQTFLLTAEGDSLYNWGYFDPAVITINTKVFHGKTSFPKENKFKDILKVTSLTPESVLRAIEDLCKSIPVLHGDIWDAIETF